ncbi:MAG: hypothetical protein AAF081_09900 [Actinomycetota bacterium]
MLRASVTHHGSDIQPDRIVGGADECGVEHAKEIFALTDAVVLRDTTEYPDARIRAELRIGRDATDRLVMVAANFQQMNRMMDAIGGPVASGLDPLAAEMGLAVPDHLAEARR